MYKVAYKSMREENYKAQKVYGNLEQGTIIPGKEIKGNKSSDQERLQGESGINMGS